MNPRLARPVPRDRVIVLVQRFFLLDTDGLRPDRLWWLGEVFLQAFVALTVYLVTNRFPYLHQGTGKIERIYEVAEGDPNQHLRKRSRGQMETYAETNPMISVAKYNGLNRIAIASFQPKTINTAYIQYGICAMLDTVLLFAST